MNTLESILNNELKLAEIVNMSRFHQPYDTSMGFGVESRDKTSLSTMEGQRVKLCDAQDIYFIDAGKHRLIPSDRTHSNLFFDYQFIIELESFDGIPEGPPLDEDAILARPSGEMPVFLVDGGIKRHIDNPKVMARCHFNYFRVYQVPPILLRDIPTGPTIR